MTARRWVRVTSCDNVPLREGRAVSVGGREVAIFNLGDRFLATGNECPHRGGPLCDGIVTGSSVVCPLHAWKIDLESGAVERPTSDIGRRIDVYATRIEDGIVCVEVPGQEVACPTSGGADSADPGPRDAPRKQDMPRNGKEHAA